MKAVVFGSGGYVGASIYEALRKEEKLQVIGVDLNEETKENMVKLDVNDPENFSQVYKEIQPNVIIWALMAGAEEQRLSDEGLLHLISHMTPSTKLVYLSSDYVFARGRGPYSETDVLQTMADDHGMSKYANAKIKSERFIEKELTNFVILRSGPVYGKNARDKLDAHTENLEQTVAQGMPAHYRDDLIRTFVHIEDLSKIVAEMALNDRTGVYHVGPAKQESFYEFMRKQAKQAGYDEALVKKEERKLQMNLPQNTALLTDRLRMITSQQMR
ncbi:sugar nucleotide-binding protein [Aciduricibacillus chroicocephali]|uniref:dTDP-4-dehydrorhamnose reductase n=1 Tax=Aciduricibacillus chroicocephali TaxID=3054939 RepID=A0ABY9KUP3_9BACI|nr:sugar nucleotide-binding protein [Bacillaceae bacterium 44XB]